MTRPHTAILCGSVLLAGIAIGATLDSWQLPQSVAANAINAKEANRLYKELGGDTSSLFEGSRQLAKIAALTTPSVVHIQSERRTLSGGIVQETGSGAIITSDKVKGTYIATNRHVIFGSEPNQIEIHLQDGRVIHPERIVSDKATDVAVLKVSAKDLQPARWGDSDKVEIGHMVLAMGSPFGLSQSVTMGIISAKGRRSLKLGNKAEVINQNFLQTDAAINPGNSGGPLIDLHGRIIGVNTAIASNSGGNDGIGFSIPSNLVRRVIDELLVNGKVQRAFLGVRLDDDFDADTAKRLKLERVRGARIVEVYPNTPASRANLKFDDVILSFGGVDVIDENHLINLVSLTPVDKRVKMSIFRSGKRVTMEVVLGDRTDLEERSEAPSRP
jgi:serine protease Do